jgi:hypothetical protein
VERLRATTAAAAVAVVIAAAVAVPHLLRSTSPVPVISAVPGAPPFVVLQPYFGGDSAPSRLVVQAAGTPHVLGFVPAPHGTRWESVAATGSSTTFVAAAGSRGSNCAIQIDLASGRVTPFWVYTPAGEFPEAVAW